MGTEVKRARAADTSLSLKDTSDIHRKSPSRYMNERIQECLRKTPNSLKSDQGLDAGVKSKDTLKMSEPIVQRTRRKFKLQHPSKAKKDKDILGRLQIEAEV